MRHVTSLALVLLVGGAAPVVADQPRTLAVKADRLFGGDRGILAVTDRGLEFRAADPQRTRAWTFDGIREVRVPSPRRVVVETYEAPRRLAFFSRGRHYSFDVVEGTVSADFVDALLREIPRPVVTSVMPPTCDATWSGAVFHEQRRAGHDGLLELHCGGLMFRSSTPAASRYWRVRDVVSILRLRRDRLEIAVRESGDVKPYVFELKRDLPDEVYDALWARMHAFQTGVADARRAASNGGVR